MICACALPGEEVPYSPDTCTCAAADAPVIADCGHVAANAEAVPVVFRQSDGATRTLMYCPHCVRVYVRLGVIRTE